MKEDKHSRREDSSDSVSASDNEECLCGKCGKRVLNNQDAIACDLCKIWHHIGCVGIAKDEYKFLRKTKRIKWFCITCDRMFGNMAAANRELKDKIDRMEGNQNSLENRLGGLQTEFKKMNEALMNLTVEIGRLKSEGNIGPRPRLDEVRAESQVPTTELIREEMREIKDKEMRKNNLVLYNVPESNEEEARGRKAEDGEWCRKIFSGREGLGLNVGEEEIVEIIRLGRREELSNVGNGMKPRPMLVRMSSATIKWEIIKNGKKLKNANEVFKKIYIAPDLTKKEREEDKKLREELEQKKSSGEQGWYIRSGRLMKNENFRN